MSVLKLLGNVLGAPVTGPVKGLQFIVNAIQDQVEGEVFDESKVQGELMQLGLRHQMGEIDDAEYTAQEDALLERLNEIRRYKESLMQDDGDVDTLADGDDAGGEGPSGGMAATS